MHENRQAPRVVVGVCTFRRPAQLQVLLRTLDQTLPRYRERLDVQVLVVDDEPVGGARETVAAADTGNLEGRLHYRHAGSASLSTARNTVIEEGIALGAVWLVFCDDDCVPHPDWLDAFLDVQARTGADMVTGSVEYRTRPGAPAWLRDQPFSDHPVYADAEEPPYGNTANVLLRAGFLVDSGVRFRSSLGQTGGEDMTFYADARAAGAMLRYSTRSVVYEELSPGRERFGYHLHRKFWLGNNMVVINRHTRLEPPARLLARGIKWTALNAARPFQRLAKGEDPQFRWSLAQALEGLGLVAGVAGVTVRHRS